MDAERESAPSFGEARTIAYVTSRKRGADKVMRRIVPSLQFEGAGIKLIIPPLLRDELLVVAVIPPLLRDELLVVAAFDDLAVFEDEDDVGVADGVRLGGYLDFPLLPFGLSSPVSD